MRSCWPRYVDFFAVRFVDFLAPRFVDFFAVRLVDFFAVRFVDFFAARLVDFFAARFVDFFADFLAVFFDGTLPPSRRASDRPMAIACLRLFTFFPELPLRSDPDLRSCIAFSTFDCAFFPYLAMTSSRSIDPTRLVTTKDGRDRASVTQKRRVIKP